MKPHRYVTLASLIGLVACGGETSANEARLPAADRAATRETQPVQSNILVSSAWLAERLETGNLVVLHVGPDRAAYDAGHVPGARFLPVSAYVVEADGIANELPPAEHLDSVFESVGVSDGSRVVVYGPPLAAARAFFTLDYLGHGDSTALLNGGIEAWRAEARAVSTEAPGAATGSFTPRPRPEIVVEADWVAENLENDDVVLIDARPEAEYSGDEAGDGVPRPGHIPGAANLFWRDMIVAADDPTLRSPDTLRALFEAADATPESTVVTYCRTGMQASFAYFVARYLGYETRMYDGGFMDWSRRSELPVEVPGDEM